MALLAPQAPRRPQWLQPLVIAGFLLSVHGRCAAPVPVPLQPAERALLAGRADEATNLLARVLSADPGNASAHLLRCRLFLAEAMGKQAAGECQTALANGLSQNSEAQDWTGRALGEEASHAGMLSGMRLAGAVRSAFETAARLDPSSEAANVDLGEFYTSAPSIVGGGTSKALALAGRIETQLPETAHRIRAMAAEKNNDLVSAEREFQAEAHVAGRAGALVDLAAFYNRHNQPAKAVATAQQTLAADRIHDATVVEAAGVLSDAHQPAPAEAALRLYLEHGEHSDQAPAFRVETMLGDLLAKDGQTAAARAAYRDALALFSHYGPAEKGLAAL